MSAVNEAGDAPRGMTSRRAVGDMPLWRLYALRVGYLLLAVGLGMQIWPSIIFRHASWELMEGVVQCMLGALSFLALFGLRHPVRMLPLLLFEVVWKLVWLGFVAAPQLVSGQMDDQTASVLFACLFVVIFLVIIPWPYVVSAYVKARGDRWGRA